MAKKRAGQSRLSDGFYLLASDLYRALQLGDFLPTEWLLIGQAHEIGWSPGLLDGTREPRPFVLNLSHLARISGRSRRGLIKARDRLVMYRVFVPHNPPDGSLWINKHYTEWLDADGGRRFTAPQVRWIEEADPKGSVRLDLGGSGYAGV